MAATHTLLSSEAFIKGVTSISDNLAGKYLLPSLREAQEIGLREIIGSCLLEALKQIVAEKATDAEGNEAYKALLDRCQYYLAYKTVVETTLKASYKVGNFGVVKSTDENLQVASFDEIAKMQDYYQAKADAHCLGLQRWLLDNRQSFTELDDCACGRMRANLTSAASCGIWLGGPRGKGVNTCGRR